MEKKSKLPYQITCNLQNNNTAKFLFDNADIAKQYYDELRFKLVVGNLAIKGMEFINLNK